MTGRVTHQRPALVEAVIDGDQQTLERLLTEGCDVNAHDTAGWTALHFAAQRQDAWQIQRLLDDAGDDLEVADDFGDTPLHRAVFCYRRDGSALAALKAAGADEAHVNKSGVSPMGLARSVANYNVAFVL